MQAYEKWTLLHRRHVSNQTLTTEEHADYERGCREMDSTEILDGNLERLRSLRTQIAEAEIVQSRLRSHEQELDARIAYLESRLDTRTRQLLGIRG